MDSVDMKLSYFGEGNSMVDGVLYVLTWTNGKCVMYSVDAEQEKITELGEINIPSRIGQGWGAATDGEYLYISNGSSSIFKVEVSPQSGMTVKSEVKVKYANGREAKDLNELEYVNGTIFANVFPSMNIVNIDLEDGSVVESWTMPDEMFDESTDHLNR